MRIDTSSSQPIFLQIAKQLEDAIFSGIYAEGAQVPSTNELSALLAINPQTVLKGVTILVNEGVIYKKRGLGMFVSDSAMDIIRQKRTRNFQEDFMSPMIAEAKTLKIDAEQLYNMLKKEYNDEHNNG